MASIRRYLAFSLRTLFIALTAFAVWLGVIVHRAREEREAVKAIEALNGMVRYDWQPHATRLEGAGAPAGEIYYPRENANAGPGGPAWLRRLIGDEYFQQADRAYLIHPQADLSAAIPHLARLRGLKSVTILATVPGEVQEKTRVALPHCELKLTP